MTPRRAIEIIDASRPPSAIARQLLAARFEKLPLCSGGLDSIVGFLRLSEALRLLCRESEIDGEKLRQISKQPYFISAHATVFQQMRNFRGEGRDWGLVVNEYGDVRGLATLGDFADEIAGDLDDSESAPIRADKSGALIVEGATTLRALRRRHLHFPPTRAKTLNGLILEYMGDFPDAPACVEIGGVRMELTGESVGGGDGQPHPADPMRIARAIRILNPQAIAAPKEENPSPTSQP